MALQQPALPSLTKSNAQPDPCTICLEQITERAIAYPCNHSTFDFLCLVSWLQNNTTCPLCKTTLSQVHYDWRSPDDFSTYIVTPTPAASPHPSTSTSSRPLPRRRYPQRHSSNQQPATSAAAIARRRHIYRHNLYSLHVGSNRLSRYTDITPQVFDKSADLQSRARTWIRRELQVFDFLSTEGGTRDTSANAENGPTAPNRKRENMRKANNAEFLLSYIIALLRTVDAKSSTGQAQQRLGEFLGEAHARLFLHELLAWLRSPFTKLEDWDRAAQYADSPCAGMGRGWKR